MKIRVAEKKDYISIAKIHYFSRELLGSGFFSLTNKFFLRKYYKILLQDQDFVVMCVEDKEKRIIGFVSASLDAQKQFKTLSKHKFSLGLTLIPSILLRPTFLFDILRRYRSSIGKNKERFVNVKGARGEFWVWDVRYKNPLWAIKLYQSHLRFLQKLGLEKMFFEVDIENKKILSFHQKNGAKTNEKYLLPDGRERIIMYYDLKDLHL